MTDNAGTSSPASTAAETINGTPSNPRVTWSENDTWVLIRIWEDHLPELRGEKHNARVYDAIVAALAKMGILRTRRQLQNKFDNLTQKYRKEARERTTGSAPSAWPFFIELHRSLGTPPINDRSLVQESCPSPRGNVDEIIRGMETGSSLSSDEDGATEGCSATDACSSASDLQQEPQPSTSTSQPHGKRRAHKRKRMSHQ
ncbi:hypothetical protein HPB51_023376 [Rhipicephalus microplus]|uniref:Myb/SANT-like DNA-binding domain-containing protein n=1 Tax=Rhipicephalus microplus TaxID=6941 RepID=A0A9J6DJZ7_RHIMP|nr:hypothetical protein HPB51_023376 [Rhipicephalus microplus]